MSQIENQIEINTLEQVGKEGETPVNSRYEIFDIKTFQSKNITTRG